MNEVLERPAEPQAPPSPEKPRRSWLRRNRKWVILGAAALAVVLAVIGSRLGGEEKAAQSEYIEAPVEQRAIVSTLSDNGTLQPANSYTVTTLIEGEVLSADFEESDVVEEDTVLYRIDSSDADSSMERSQISLQQAQREYENTLERQYVKADTSGIVYELTVQVGDLVSAGQTIGSVRDTSVMRLKVPFPADDARSFHVGQSAQVTLDGSFEVLSGTVESVSGTNVVGAGNRITRTVTIAVENPGALTDTQAATAVIGGVGSSGSGTFTYEGESALVAEAAGTVVAVNTPEGAAVARDQAVVTLGGKDIEDMVQAAAEALRTTEISAETTQEQLDEYTITAPISGTIVDKEYRAGETVEAGKVLCVIYDLSYLEMTLDIDELDISQVEVGQHVTVTADAVEGAVYDGVVTKVSVAGTTVGSVTTYPVTVRIDDTEGLLPGMNADAEITLAETDEALAIPNEAVARGGLVRVTADSPSAVNAVEQSAEEGYVYVQVETGISDDDYVEIRSGLQIGDTVAYIPTGSGGSMMDFIMGGGMMSGDMMAGGMPDGGGGPGGPA